MSRGVMASSQSYTTFRTSIIRRYSVVPHVNLLVRRYTSGSLRTSRINLWCNSTGDSGEKNGCTSMLNAFLLGKAIGEVISERVESVVGEFIGVVGRLQSDHLKHISQFQDCWNFAGAIFAANYKGINGGQQSHFSIYKWKPNYLQEGSAAAKGKENLTQKTRRKEGEQGEERGKTENEREQREEAEDHLTL